ncbi:N-acetylmuramoyl-L-alanine amidase [Viridibacillus sp. YIM B01967]|uniref:N-acetylmuramoyl-L-alanine amidase n=1 Tax=Viridibacillus soli TaxID=2798301 RepID=A0ABS1HAT0_9BACL|nr:N-acetylmuramoyl-L-alanine amidase [Viridibacillus soli]MBK3496554.1 N-acetylmuramoyl-L-alanine amidase [Viridibacillus soli]
MKRWLILGTILLGCLIFVVYETQASDRGFFISETLGGVKVVLDAGHGGIDGGASKDDIIEKDITLAIALNVEKKLKKKGATVFMTRTKNGDVISEHASDQSYNTLRERKKQDIFLREQLVAKQNPDIFISIHANAIPETKWRGAQVFYHQDGHAGGEFLAKEIQSSIRENLKNTEREALSIKQVYLLKKATMPSALVETGFISNPEEKKLLISKKYQDQMADAIVEGIERYFEINIE